MVCVNSILYRQSPQQICYDEKKAGFLYLGKIVSDVTERQSPADGIPKENLQANTPIVGADVYQYDSDILVLINGKYWLYQPLINEGWTILEEYIPEGEAMLLAPSHAAHLPASKEGTISTGNAQDTPASPGGALSSKAPGEAEGNQEAEEAARAYYAGTVFEVISLEPESREGDTITFAVTVKKGGIVQEPERKITLQRKEGTWEVMNEGY